MAYFNSQVTLSLTGQASNKFEVLGQALFQFQCWMNDQDFPEQLVIHIKRNDFKVDAGCYPDPNVEDLYKELTRTGNYEELSHYWYLEGILTPTAQTVYLIKVLSRLRILYRKRMILFYILGSIINSDMSYDKVHSLRTITSYTKMQLQKRIKIAERVFKLF